MKTQSISAGRSPLAQLSVCLLIVALLAPLAAPLRAEAIGEPAKAVFNPPAPAAVVDSPAPPPVAALSGADGDFSDWAFDTERQRRQRLTAIQPGGAAATAPAFSLPSIFSSAANGESAVAKTLFPNGGANLTSGARANDRGSSAAIAGGAGSSPAAKLTTATAAAPVAPAAPPAGTRTPFDFDGDFKADVSYWRPASGVWQVQRSGSNGALATQAWGSSGDRIVPADYDNDNRTDHAVWTPASGVWQIRYSANGQSFSQQFGGSTDTPVPGDYNGDGRADLAVWRPSTGVWYIWESNSPSYYGVQFGGEAYGDIPVPGDYDGDGKTDIAIYRPNEGKWYFRYTKDGAVGEMPYGISSDVPVPADYDADGKTDFAVWRPAPGNPAATGTWYVYKSTTGGTDWAQLGVGGSQADVLVPADYDGDERADFAAWKPSSGNWYIWRSSDNQMWYPLHGVTGDVPVPAVYIKQAIPTASSTNPTGIAAAASPNSVQAGGTTRLTVQVTPGTNPPSTGITVTGNLSAIGGSFAQPFYDNGTNGDLAAGDGIYSFGATVSAGTAAGGKSLPITVGDAQGRSSGTSIGLTVTAPAPTAPTATGGASPSQLAAGTATLLTVQVTPGTNPPSTGITVTGNLSAIGGSSAQIFYDNGTNGDQVANNNVFSFNATIAATTTAGTKSLAITVTDSYPRTAGANIAVTVTTLTVPPPALGKARLSPRNQTGGTNLYSQNFGWGANLVNLPGRAGLDAGLSLAYNSLVWTRVGNAMVFDADNSNVAPGFRFGFPVIEPSYTDAQTGKVTYLMVTPSGGRVELRQNSTNYQFEAVDSSYLQLERTVMGNGSQEQQQFRLRATDGTQMSYSWSGGAYRCSRITDRNGNYIDIVHNGSGLPIKITDTLGREININNDGVSPTTITQNRQTGNGSGSVTAHTYATFTYAYHPITTNFDGLSVSGPANGTNLKVLQKVTWADGASTQFSYNSYGQVNRVTNFAKDNHTLNYTAINLPANATAPQTDCPRFTLTSNYVENFNGVNGQPAETLIHNTLNSNGTFAAGSETLGPTEVVEVWVAGAPQDAHRFKTYYHTAGNWAEGLPFATEDTVGGVRKRWTRTAWTQDDINLAYLLNPRVKVSKVGDQANVKRTEIDYDPDANNKFGLVKEVRLFDADAGGTLHKRVVNTYRTDQAYRDRRIIGLPAQTDAYGLNQQTNTLDLVSQTTYGYDQEDNFSAPEQQAASVIRHDSTNYGTGFVIGRGNLTSITEHEVAGSATIVSSIRHNPAGAVVKQITPGSPAGTTREVKISYTDSFNDGVVRNAYAYPTKITDPAGNSSDVKYRFDTGANVWAKSPDPKSGVAGKQTTRIYDDKGRLEKETVVNDGGAYTRYEYPDNNNRLKIFTTINDVNSSGAADAADEVLTENTMDGAGRNTESRTAHPGSTGQWSATQTRYDILGQVKGTSAPTEVDANGALAGDGASRTRLWKWMEYDWKGRVTKVTNTDGSVVESEYEGCGCAGGEKVTVTGEPLADGRRKQRIYADALGRQYKTEILNWSGAQEGSVYSTTLTKFNGRDQAVWVKQFVGGVPTGGETGDACPAQAAGAAQTCQVTNVTYDGFGRVKTRHAPQQDAGKATVYDYYPNGEVQKATDARGAATTYSYNSRGLVQTVNHTMPPPGQSSPPPPPPPLPPSGSQANNLPRGYLDWISTSDWTVNGWTFDPDASSESNTVHFFIDRPAGSGGTFIGSTVADKERLDVNGHFGIEGNHGYRFVIPEAYRDGQSHTIYAYGIDLNNSSVSTHLSDSPKSYAYSPNSVQPALNQTVGFEYDAAGNRLSMTDNLGRTDYDFDGLGRLKAETRKFTDTAFGGGPLTMPHAPQGNNSFRLQYSYGLGGQLKSLTDPYGAVVNYDYDAAGRLKKVAGTSFGGVTTYADNAVYQAWGGLKSLSYGSGLQMTMTHNNRLQAASYNLAGGASGQLMNRNYSYNADGALRYMQDTLDAKFDRLNIYDHVGRIKAGKTGLEARTAGEVPANEQSTSLPYRQVYEFNHFGNLTKRDNLHWGKDSFGGGQSNNLNYTYRDSRIQGAGWEYDADGRNLQSAPPDDYATSIYDAAGRMVRSQTGQTDAVRFYDGDGREIKRVTANYVETANSSNFVLKPIKYYIRSSVLGGATVSEVWANGRKGKTFVSAAGSQIAYQAAYASPDAALNEAVIFEYTDASGMSQRTTDRLGYAVAAGDGGDGSPVETDPFGGNVGTETPYIEQVIYTPDPDYPILQPHFDDAPQYVNGQRVSATLDGFPISFARAMSALQNGSADIDFRTTNSWTLSQLGIVAVYNPNSGRTAPANGSGNTNVGSSDGDVINGGTTYGDGGRWSYYFSGISWNPQQQIRLPNSEKDSASKTTKQAGPRTKEFCKKIEPNINAAKDFFTKLFNKSFENNEILERGAIVQWDEYGNGQYDIAEFTESRGSLPPAFTAWASVKIEFPRMDNGNIAKTIFFVHTHPAEKGDIVGIDKEGYILTALDPNYPSGLDGDRGVSKTLKTNGIIVSSSSIVVFGPQGRKCRFDR